MVSHTCCDGCSSWSLFGSEWLCELSSHVCIHLGSCCMTLFYATFVGKFRHATWLHLSFLGGLVVLFFTLDMHCNVLLIADDIFATDSLDSAKKKAVNTASTASYTYFIWAPQDLMIKSRNVGIPCTICCSTVDISLSIFCQSCKRSGCISAQLSIVCSICTHDSVLSFEKTFAVWAILVFAFLLAVLPVTNPEYPAFCPQQVQLQYCLPAFAQLCESSTGFLKSLDFIR